MLVPMLLITGVARLGPTKTVKLCVVVVAPLVAVTLKVLVELAVEVPTRVVVVPVRLESDSHVGKPVALQVNGPFTPPAVSVALYELPAVVFVRVVGVMVSFGATAGAMFMV